MAATGLTCSQFALLALLSEQPGIGFKSMNAAMSMDRTSLVRALKPLQRDGLVTATPAANDARQLSFSITPAAAKLVRKGERLWMKAQADIEAQIGVPAAQKMLASILLTQGIE
jgi:DNA-binding MarR family transcriptional regulator